MRTSFAKSLRTGPPVAEIRLIEGEHYRRDAFAAGLRACGYQPLFFRGEQFPTSDDVLVLWNRYSRDESRARAYEEVGATVLIAENAWLGPEEKDKHFFALSLHHHNLRSEWSGNASDRWVSLGVSVTPWRQDGEHILLLPQRGMGEPGVAQPNNWMARVVSKLHEATKRPLKIRYHPGLRPHSQIDFSNVWACVTWGSGAAIKALVAGIPVFYELENWIGASAALHGFKHIERPFVGDRQPLFNELAWRMWRTEEIATGEPFRCLLSQSMSIESSGRGRKSVPPWLKESETSATQSS